ncbi:MAG: hypothetical protein M1826_007489 [Phylliscum demangeonii]|nr:MAG: hypothetical protein M1826_007489 [Phylliscum demangeonii]
MCGVVLAIGLTAFFQATSALPQQPPPSGQKAPASQPFRQELKVALAAGIGLGAAQGTLVELWPNACLKLSLRQRGGLDRFRGDDARPWGANAAELTMWERSVLESDTSVEEIISDCERRMRRQIDMNRNANIGLLYQGYGKCMEDLHKSFLKTGAMPANAGRDFCVKRWRLPNVFEPGRLATGERADVRVNVPDRNRMPFHVEEVVRGVQHGAHKLESEVSRGARRLAVPLYRNSPAFLKEEEAALFAHGA